MTETIRECLIKLPQQQRAVLKMYYYKHLTQLQIGQIYHIDQCNVSRLIQKSLSTLRKLVTEEINAK